MEFIILIALIILIVIVVASGRLLRLRTKVHESILDKVILKISVPSNNRKKALAAEQLFQAIHGILRNNAKAQDAFSFEIVSNLSGIYFIVVCNKKYQQFLENQIYAQYPEIQIDRIKDYVQKKASNLFVTELTLQKDFYLPIKTFQNFEVDPLASITGAMSKMQSKQEAWLQLVIRPVADEWQGIGRRFIQRQKTKVDSDGKRITLLNDEQFEIKQIDTKNSKPGFQFALRILVQGDDSVSTQQILYDIEASLKQFQAPQLNSLVPFKGKKTFLQTIGNLLFGKRKVDQLNSLEKFENRFLDEREIGIINVEEVASIYHFPNESVQTPNIARSKSKRVEPPKNLPVNRGDSVRTFALSNYRGRNIPFGIKQTDRRRHMYLVGKTGSGKSTMIKNMAIGDIYSGFGVSVIDPHGDLIEDILDAVPNNRLEDVIVLDPSDVDYPIGLNMLDIKEGESMELLADGIVSVFIRLFGNSWGPRLQYILTNTILTLLHCQNVSLLAVQRILTDKNYRFFLLKQVKDPFLIKFWEQEFAQMEKNSRLITEALSPIQNKVGRFLSSPMVRNMIGQVSSKVDLQKVMDNQKILLVNLSQGKIGEENSMLLGGMLVTRLYTNAMQRARIAESERKDFYLYVDEFQNFATDTFIKILSEARKYALNLFVTHQYIDQVSQDIQDAIFGNVGTLMNYVVGPKDAKRLEREYTPQLSSEDLVNLPRFEFAVKLNVDGTQSAPFTARALPPMYKHQGFKEEIKQINRERYAIEKLVVEEKLSKWAAQRYDKQGRLI